jgi:hypothetical protein
VHLVAFSAQNTAMTQEGVAGSQLLDKFSEILCFGIGFLAWFN